MKTFYEELKLEVIEFETEDIITASGETTATNNGTVTTATNETTTSVTAPDENQQDAQAVAQEELQEAK